MNFRRNDQRSTVKRPGTKEYSADFRNKEDQFYGHRNTRGCPHCGSTNITARGGNGRIFVYCASCGKQLRVINTKPTSVGNWSKTTIYRIRAGLCTGCGGHDYVGTCHYDPVRHKYSLKLTCRSCGTSRTWHNL